MKKKGEDREIFWNKRSKVFDGQVQTVYENAYKKTIRRSLEFVNEENTVLEIGCGTGIVTIPMSDCVKKITATDISEAMLEKAKEKAEKQGKENIEFINADFMDLDAEPGSFDVVTAYNVLLYMKHADEVLDRIHEILKPGGIFISATDCLGRNLSGDAVKKFWKSRLHLMPYVAFDTPPGLVKKIQDSGFLVLQTVNLHRNPPNIFIVAQKKAAP